MASIELWFDTDKFPLKKDSYEVSFHNEDKQNKTEAGTIIRDVQRFNVPHLSVSCAVDDTWYQLLHSYNGQGTVTIKYFSPATLSAQTFDGFIENLKFSLVSDLTKTYWKASFEVTAY